MFLEKNKNNEPAILGTELQHPTPKLVTWLNNFSSSSGDQSPFLSFCFMLQDWRPIFPKTPTIFKLWSKILSSCCVEKNYGKILVISPFKWRKSEMIYGDLKRGLRIFFDTYLEIKFQTGVGGVGGVGSPVISKQILLLLFHCI